MKRLLVFSSIAFAVFYSEATDGIFTGHGDNLLYHDVANWQDGVIAEGSGAIASFTHTEPTFLTLDQPLVLGFLSDRVSSVLTLRGEPLVFANQSESAIAVSGRLNIYTPISGDVTLRVRGGGSLYPTAPIQITGPIYMDEGGLIGLDFNSYASDAETTVANILPESALIIRKSSVVRIGPHISRSGDQTISAELTQDSPFITLSDVTTLSAGQRVIAENGALPDGTFIKAIYADYKRIELSTPAIFGGTVSLTVKAATFTTSQTLSDLAVNAPLSIGGKNAVLQIKNEQGLTGNFPLSLGMNDEESLILRVKDPSKYYGPFSVNKKTEVQVGNGSARPIPETLPVSDCVFHVDASLAATLTLGEGNTVLRWTDASGGANAASTPAGAQPAVLLDNALNGLPVVDFGEACGDGGMEWDAAIDDVRDVFMVIGTQAGGGTLLGTKVASSTYYFERGMDPWASKGSHNAGIYRIPLTQNHALFWADRSTVRAWLNGDDAEVLPRLSGFSRDYDLVMFRCAKQPATASAFARRAGLDNAKRIGREAGQRLAEVVIYNRELTDTERRDVEAYLLKKWFGKERLGYGITTVHSATLTPQSGYWTKGLLTHSENEPVRVKRLKTTLNTSDTAYYTIPEGQHIIADRAEIGHRLRMMGGKITVTARQTHVTLPVPNPVLHLDATVNVTCDGSGKVIRWDDASGGTGYAAPEDEYAPTLIENGQNGLPVIDFGNANSRQHLVWNTNHIVRSLFVVLKVTNSKNSFIGSSCSTMGVVDHFTRYTGDGYIWCSGGVENLSSGFCYLNGLRIGDPRNYPLNTGSFHSLSQVIEGSLMANAFGCGAYQATNPRAERTGGLQLAEAIIYDRQLTEEESLDIHAYLRWKWFGETITGYAAPGEAYTIQGIGSGKSGSSLEILGNVPTEIVTKRFGGGDLVISAPDTTVSIDFEGSQGVQLAGGLLRAKSNTIPSFNALEGYASGVDVAEGETTTITRIASSGSFIKSGPGKAVIVAEGGIPIRGNLEMRGGELTLPNAGIANVKQLYGNGTITGGPITVTALGSVGQAETLDIDSLNFAQNATITVDIGKDGVNDLFTTCDLEIPEKGTITLAFPDDIPIGVGMYQILSFGVLSAESQANLKKWSVSLIGNLLRTYQTSILVRDNAIFVSITNPGTLIVVK